VADTFITTGQARTALVVGAETMSRLMDWNDRSTCVLFGDGAGALLLTATSGAGTAADRGVLNTRLFSDGRLHDLRYVDGGPSTTGSTGYLQMQGKEVFRHAVTKIAAAVEASTEAAGVALREIDWFVPH
jgi:3-oxoacyl-[acyl-carrier-protein] synthase-3